MTPRHHFLAFGSVSLAALLAAYGCSDQRPGTIPDPEPGGKDAGDGGWVVGDVRVPADAGTLVLSQSSVDFGKTACGTTASPRTLTFTNGGLAKLEWTAALEKKNDSPFTLDPPSGSLEGLGSKLVYVIPKKIDATTSSPAKLGDNDYGDIITITTDRLGDVPRKIPILQTARGALLAVSPDSLNFQSVAVGQTAEKSLKIINVGNEKTNFSLTSNNIAFSVGGTSATSVGEKTEANVSLIFGPSAAQAETGSLRVAVPPTTPMCGGLPDPVVMTGVGTQGKLAVDKAEIRFGDNGYVNCGDTATAQSISVRNTGTASLSWEGTLTAGSAYYTLTPSSGTIQPSGTATITITTKQIPQVSPTLKDYYSGTLALRATSGSSDAVVIPLYMTARGVVLTSSLSGSYAFGPVYVNQSLSTQVSVTNLGNQDAKVMLAVGNTPTFSIDPAAEQPLEIGKSKSFSLAFSPPGTNDYNDTLTVIPAPGTVLCQPVPGAVAVSGSGSNSIAVSPTTLDFGIVDCGTDETNAQNTPTVTIENRGTQQTFVTSLGKGANSPYEVRLGSVTGPQTNVDTTLPNGVTTLAVKRKKLSTVANTNENGQGDTLTITYKGQGAPSPTTVSLNQTARGAIFEVTPVNVTEVFTTPNTSFRPVVIKNAGNFPGTFQFRDAILLDASGQVDAGRQCPEAGLPYCCPVDRLVCVVGSGEGTLAAGASKTVTLWVNPIAAQQVLSIRSKSNVDGTYLMCADDPGAYAVQGVLAFETPSGDGG